MTLPPAPSGAQVLSTHSASGSPAEARHAPRRPATDVPEITRLRISPRGTEAALVNISTSGLLVECSEGLRPRSQVTVVFEGGFSPSSVEGRVARCAVASVTPKGTLRYHVGIAFSKPIALPDNSAVAGTGAQPTAPKEAPVHTKSEASPQSAAPANTESPVRNRW